MDTPAYEPGTNVPTGAVQEAIAESAGQTEWRVTHGKPLTIQSTPVAELRLEGGLSIVIDYSRFSPLILLNASPYPDHLYLLSLEELQAALPGYFAPILRAAAEDCEQRANNRPAV